jgi:hypothetical protein
MGLTWQHVGDDSWLFGRMVRGLVRDPVAEAYYDEDHGWVWFLHGCQTRGLSSSLQQAIKSVEEILVTGARKEQRDEQR